MKASSNVASWHRRLISDRFLRLSKEGFWVILGQVAAVSGALTGVRLLTEQLGPVAYGELTLSMTAAILINQVVFGPLGNGVTRFYPLATERDDFGGYLNATCCLVLWGTGAVVLIFFLAIVGLWISDRTHWIALAAAILFFGILAGYVSILNGMQSAARQRPIVALHQGMEPWARFLSAVALLVRYGATSTVAVSGYVLGMMFVLASQSIFFRKLIPQRVSRRVGGEDSWMQQIWVYSRPFAFWGILSWAQIASDRWALELFTTTQEVGLYAVLFQLGYAPMLLGTGMAMQFLSPIVYQRAGDARDHTRNANLNKLNWRLTGLILGLTGVAFGVALHLHEQIFLILVAKEYGVVSYLLPWILLAGGVFAASQTIALNLMGQMKTQTLIAPKVITALLGILCNLAGAYWWGTAGVVMAGLAVSVLYLLWMAVLSINGGQVLYS